MAETSYPLNHPLAVKVWSKRLMREALKMTHAGNFMGSSKDSLIYVKDDLNKGPGDRIRVGLRMQLSGAGVIGDGTLEGNEEELTTYTDDLFIDQLRHAVKSGGEMSEQRIPFSVREEALDGLRDWYADRIDTAFFNQIAGNTSVSETFAGLNSPLAATSAAGNTRVLYGASSTTLASLTASFTTTASGFTRGEAFDVRSLDRAINVAKTATPLIRPIRVEGQYKYVCFLHPNQVRQLRKNNTANTVTWYDIMRARVQGGETNNPIFNGALGEYNGVILYESTRVPQPPGNDMLRSAIFCGAQAACFATGRRDQGTNMKWTEELFDYENKLGVSASLIWGLKKTQFNSIDFGTIVIHTQSVNPV